MKKHGGISLGVKDFVSDNAIKCGFKDVEVSHMIYGGSIFELDKFYDAQVRYVLHHAQATFHR
ncbi:hypothetical protein MTR_7g065900 [Medicago truncatula]|uniref:Uncharacterized protein n=1 Tax=Medicago truncatula TaxID=3880 RepID=A0A072U0V1_MEDTR|nr:hypothetical protein MTR_7g065900 [Medicago truncatula]